VVPKPALFSAIPRHYRRYGLPRQLFRRFLTDAGPFDVALIQTVMTYWYLGVKEVIDDIRAFSPRTQIVLGGVYATLCSQHAQSLGADLVIERSHLDPLWRLLHLTPGRQEAPLWEAYAPLRVGVLKLTDGCPFRCTYCSVPQVYPPFVARPLAQSCAELEGLRRRGVRNVAFYDDALLFKPDQILLPFLRHVLRRGIDVHLHTPNALNARFLTKDVATLMVQAGFKTFYLGFESSAYQWQRRTGGKVYADELAQAVDHLVSAGADMRQITAYLIIAHPQAAQQDVEASMHFAHSVGVRLMLSEFSPIPGTPDGERCRQWVDLDEPLWHNKTVFPVLFLGAAEVQRLKMLCRQLNHQLDRAPDAPMVEQP
jgi:tRNA A37 methylthiotransferase MiaB